jgi:hypothetical protein
MSTGLIILIILIVIFGYILFFPLTLKIDTDRGRYYFRLPGVFGFRVWKGKSGWKTGYSIFLFRFNIQLFNPHKQRKTDEERPEASAGSLKKRFRTDYLSLAARVIRSFRLKRLRWNIDTGDYPLNAQLIPVASFLSSDRVDLSVNFQDNNAFYIILQSYLARIIYITIRHFMFNR